MRRNREIIIRVAKAQTGEKNAVGEALPAYGTPREMRMALYPVRDATAAQEYGLTRDCVRRLILPPGADISAPDGVWLPEETGEDPPWIVADASAWPRHTDVLIRRTRNDPLAGS